MCWYIYFINRITFLRWSAYIVLLKSLIKWNSHYLQRFFFCKHFYYNCILKMFNVICNLMLLMLKDVKEQISDWKRSCCYIFPLLFAVNRLCCSYKTIKITCWLPIKKHIKIKILWAPSNAPLLQLCLVSEMFANEFKNHILRNTEGRRTPWKVFAE